VNGLKISKFLKEPASLFSIFMWGIMLHSLIIGISLIFSPSSLFEFFGYNKISENFFHIQGGVFHIVMSIGYALAAFKPCKYEGVVFLSVLAKFVAVLFLMIYSSIVKFIPVVFFSGIGDLIMGIFILILYKRINCSKGTSK
jgi:hypothetical protein